MNKTNYPDKFVAKTKGECLVTWNVTKIDENSWNWVTDTGTDVGDYPAGHMDEFEHIEFIFPEEAPQEPSLVLPFTFKHNVSQEEFQAAQGSQEDRLDITGVGLEFYIANQYSKDSAKRHIKNGSWIVTSVGEQKSSEAPSSRYDSESTHTLKVDTAPAIEAMNALAGAIESVNIGLESMQKLMAEMGLSGQEVSASKWNDIKFDLD